MTFSRILVRQVILVFASALKVIADATHLGYPAILLPTLREPGSSYESSKHIDSWIASAPGLGMLCGLALVPLTIDRYGRKACHVASGIPMAIGWLWIIFAENSGHFIGARFIQGLTVGYRTPISTMVIAESTDPRYRGAFLATVSLSLGAGIFYSHFTGTFLTWQQTAIACLLLGIIGAVLLIFLPDSPTWLAKVGRFVEARKAFIYYRGDAPESCEEIENIINTQVELNSKQLYRGNFMQNVKNCLSLLALGEFYKPLFIMFVIFTAYTFAGTYVMSSYTVDIIKKITGSGLSPYLIMNSIDLVRISVSIVSLFLIRKFRRRVVYFTSIFITIISLVSLSLYLYLDSVYIIDLEYIPLLSLLGYIIGLGTGIQALPYVLLGELFSVRFKGFGSSLSAFYMSICYFVSIAAGPYMFADLGEIGTFLVYASIIFVCWGILYFILPETKDKTLQEIEDTFKKVVKVENGKEYELQGVKL